MRKLPKFDGVLLGLIFLILILGLPVLLSVAPELIGRQLLWILIGLIAFFAFSQTDYRRFENWALIFYLFSVFLLILTFIFGQVIRGSTRWLTLGSWHFQASEIIKPLIILSFASLTSKLDLKEIRNLLFLLFLMISLSLLIFFQPDLSSTMVIIFVTLSIVFLAGLNFKFFLLMVILISASLPLVWQLLKDYQKNRLMTFFNPFSDPLGKGYHLLQSIVAIGSGGFLGRGLGRGTQSHLRFLPEYHTDFIYASLAEELGFLGSVLLIIIFWLLLWRILTAAQRTEDQFGSLICLGVFSFIFFQIFVNIGMNMGLLPITGIPLPLVSYGGSSLLATMISLGLVSSVVNFSQPEDHLEIH